jgi:hypothetical protein
MKRITQLLLQLLAAMSPPNPERADAVGRSAYERFALPFAFKPRLSFAEAAVAVVASLLRIFLGSLLFAVWGAYALEIWFHVGNLFLRWAVLLPYGIVFLFAIALLMAAIASIARALLPAKSFRM